jgi:hypothetical protein
MKATEIFKPNDFPTETYVRRRSDDAERRLRDALGVPNSVVSISGPSKSGKTVLVQKVIGEENLVQVSGAEIRVSGDLWERVLDWFNLPANTTSTNTETGGDQEIQTFGGSAGVPGTNATINTSMQHSSTSAGARSETRNRGGLQEVEYWLSGSAYVLFIDDFHYIEKTLQKDIARQIKAAAGKGVRICVASVPHRADDVVRSNPELRGRTTNIDIAFWKPGELTQIALLGFPKLNVEISPSDARILADEACGSPQLMQQVCLQLCFVADLRESADTKKRVVPTRDFRQKVLEQTAATAEYGSLVRQMHKGAKRRGMERTKYRFIDTTDGDVYRGVLLALRDNPPLMQFPYNELIERVKNVCWSQYPPSVSITQACHQIANIAYTLHKDQRILEWDEETETLDVVDPYFLFYLRGSNILSTLAKPNP